MRYILLLLICPLAAVTGHSQTTSIQKDEILRGSINPDREWWDVLHYDVTIEPEFDTQFTKGKNIITYQVTKEHHADRLQIDLQPPLQIDHVQLDAKEILGYQRAGNVYYIPVPQQKPGSTHCLEIAYSGNPTIAKNPPWDGGWTFTQDKKGRPWMTVTCQGLGASVWYPLKDHQSDEPDQGARLTMIVPKELTGVANGRLLDKQRISTTKTAYTWGVTNPINNYTLIPYIGNYVDFTGQFLGLRGELDLTYWVLDYNLEKAKSYLPKEARNTLMAFEYWFGAYPFYKDGYQLVETEHPGMEHQSAVAYGNNFEPGYGGRDLSGTGIGLKWDFIVVHESGHEWFGNNITTNDLADMYVHESFTTYSETLYVEYHYGENEANAYNYGMRRIISNDRPIIPAYGINAQGSGDMYSKGSTMIHTIRHSIDDDKLFRNILAGLNGTFGKKTIDGAAVQQYISRKANFDYTAVFKQYLTTIQIPVLEVRFATEGEKVSFRWTNCISSFDLPLMLKDTSAELKIYPTTEWTTLDSKKEIQKLFDPESIQQKYYVSVETSELD